LVFSSPCSQTRPWQVSRAPPVNNCGGACRRGDGCCSWASSLPSFTESSPS
jgi:hypothetical protein